MRRAPQPRLARATVPGRFFRTCFEVAARHGYEVATLEDRLIPEGIEDEGRYPWALYAEMGDELVALIGSDARVVEVFATWGECFPELVAAVAHMTDPLELAVLVSHHFSNPDTQPMLSQTRPLSGNRFEFQADIPRSVRGSRGGGIISAGLLAGQPCLIGLPPAHVEILAAESHFVHAIVTLPPPRPPLHVAPVRSQAQVVLQAITRDTQRYRAQAERLRDFARELGAVVSRPRALDRACAELVALLAASLDASFALLWLQAGPASRLGAAHGTRDGGSRLFPLEVGDRVVGTVELPVSTDENLFEPIVPLLAAALAGRLAVPSRWRLSPAEAAVCEQLARGSTNADIARTLGIAENTVAEHVSRALTKSGCTRRTEIVARWRTAAENGPS